mgnify:CR=1 FL=1
MINFSYTFPEPIEINGPCEPLFKEFLKKVEERYSYYCIEDIDLKNDTLNDLQEISRLLTIK